MAITDENQAARELIATPLLLEREDWTPQQALEYYAAGRHFDVVNGHTRILDTGAIASDALKQLSPGYAETKGLGSPGMSASSPIPSSDWLWGKLMDWCRTRGVAPADYNDLFAIVAEARASQPPSSSAV